MNTNAELTAEFTRLNDALDRASEVASRILGDLSPGNDNAIPISRESVLDELGRLMRVTTELRKLTGELNLEATSTAESANLSRTQTLWESIRERYGEALDVWEDLGETITGSMTTHLLAQHPRDPALINADWETIFLQEADIQAAISIIEALGTPTRPKNVEGLLYKDPTPDQLKQELSDKYILQLKYSLGMTQAEIGRLMGVGQAAAATRLGRAIDRLEPLLAKFRTYVQAHNEMLTASYYTHPTLKNRIAVRWDYPPVETHWASGTQVDITRTQCHTDLLVMPPNFTKPLASKSLGEQRKDWAHFRPQLTQAGYLDNDGVVSTGGTEIDVPYIKQTTVNTGGELQFWAVGLYCSDFPRITLIDSYTFARKLKALQIDDNWEPFTVASGDDFRTMGQYIIQMVTNSPETHPARLVPLDDQ